MRIRLFVIAGIIAGTLSGCGETPLQQSLFGAGAGATTAAVLDADLATGALIGAVGNVAYCQQYPENC